MDKYIINAPFVEQMPELPRGCEVTSLSLLLRHAGVLVDKMELASAITKVPFKQGNLHGHLNDGFVGDMYSFETDGLGVYYKPILELANRYLPQQIINLTGTDMKDIFDSIKKGYPVWVLTNVTFNELEDHHFKIWHTKHGKLRVTYKMHSVLVVGYDQENIYIQDPLHDAPNRPIKHEPFEKAWIQMGRQALTYRKKDSSGT